MAVNKVVAVKLLANVDGFVSAFAKAKGSVDGLAKANIAAPQKAMGDLTNKAALLGVAVAVGIGKAVASFADFDAAMSGAAAASQATGGELESLRDAAIRAGADTQYSATQAADAITELSKAGVSTADILGGGLTGALNLAAAGQLDVADAAEIAATAMTQFKLGGNQVNHVADLLAAGAGKAQGSVGDMGMALKQTGLVANQTGLTIEETTAGLTAFASAGLIGSDAGTSFKSMLQRLTPQSEEAAGLMDELGISAYDAGGNFIGLEGFAGNLQQALKDLTPEQRNSALATIFGSDAVRAASVLYDQGATGIAKWTDEVNQQGFAAKQAAALTDNLKGDIERLGGAFDTALIQTGSGANDTLRTLVQTGESLIEVVAKIPSPVLLGAAAFGALALVGPKIGALAKTVTGPLSGGMAQFRDEMALHRALATQVAGGYQRLGDEAAVASGKVSRSAVAMSAAKSSIGGLKGAASGVLGVLGGPWGLALTAATAGVTMWAQSQADARAAADDLSATIDTQTGKFTEASNQSIVAALIGDLSPEDVQLVQSLGVNFVALGDAALQGGPALSAQQQHLVALMQEYQRSGGILSDEGRALEGLVRSLDRAGGAADAARVKQEVLAQASNEAQIAQSNMAQSANAAERGMQDLGTATSGAATAADAAGTAMDGINGLLADLGAKSDDAKASVDGLKSAVDLLAGGEIALRAAQRDLADSLDSLGEAQKAKTDKTHTAAQVERDYRAALDKVGTATASVIKQQIDNDASTSALTRTYNTQRAAVIESLKAHGVHKDALNREADSIVGTKGEFAKLLAEYKKNPKEVATTVKTPNLPQSQAAVKGYWSVIDGVPTFHETTFQANTSTAIGRINSLQAELAAIPRTVNTTHTIQTIHNEIVMERKGINTNLASGGPVIGPGTGTSDSVLMRGSNGEHMLTAAEVAAAGGHGAIFALRRAILSGNLPRFATGGPVTAPSMTTYLQPVSTGMDYGRLASIISGSAPRSGGRQGPLVAIGTVNARDEKAAAAAIETRFSDSLRVYNLEV